MATGIIELSMYFCTYEFISIEGYYYDLQKVSWLW